MFNSRLFVVGCIVCVDPSTGLEDRRDTISQAVNRKQGRPSTPYFVLSADTVRLCCNMYHEEEPAAYVLLRNNWLFW